jgi:hypothetical protein
MKKKRKKEGDDDEGEADGEAKKIRRPDVSQRKQERKNLESSVVKASLRGRLCKDDRHWTPEARDTLLQLLDAQVESLSQMVVRGSMVANEVLQVCLREGLPLPDLSSPTFFRHCIVGKSTDSVITRVLNSQFGNHPAIARIKGDWAAVNILTNRYATNVQNSFVVPFLDRQRAFVAQWLKHMEFDKSYQSDIIRQVNGWPRSTTPRVFPLEVHELIERHRQLLQEPQDLHPKMLHPHVVVHYYYELQRFYDSIGYARISLLPLCNHKRHFMTIDKTVLLNLLLNVFERMGERAPRWIQDIALYNNICPDAIHVCRDEMWHKTFGIRPVKASSKRRFDYQVDTDGIAACFHFSVPKRPDPEGTGLPEEEPFQAKDRVIAIDPGRTNLITAYDSFFDKFHTLSRKQYYGSFQGSLRKIKIWEETLQPVHEEMSAFSLRSGDSTKCEGYRSAYWKWYDTIWTSRLARNRARESLNVFSKKKKVLDIFFSKMKGPLDAPPPKVAYGAASIRPHAHGEMSVPVKGVLKVCRKYYPTTLINEHLTTKTHEACGSRMHPAKNEGETDSKPIRGLYWCQTCGKFVNRDRNAALNILLLARSIQGRPSHLAFGQPAVYMRPLTLLPPKRTKNNGLGILAG